jgi:hypothetical protein
MYSRGGRSGCHYSTLHENKKTMKADQINFDADFYTKHAGISSRGLYTIDELTSEDELDLSQEVMANDSVEL